MLAIYFIYSFQIFQINSTKFVIFYVITKIVKPIFFFQNIEINITTIVIYSYNIFIIIMTKHLKHYFIKMLGDNMNLYQLFNIIL